jgi:hypothetical protein
MLIITDAGVTRTNLTPISFRRLLLLPKQLPFGECCCPGFSLFPRPNPTSLILVDSPDDFRTVNHFHSKVLDVAYVNVGRNELPGFAMKANRDHSIASSGIAACDVNFCSATKLSGALLRFLSARPKCALLFDVGDDSPHSRRVSTCSFSGHRGLPFSSSLCLRASVVHFLH